MRKVLMFSVLLACTIMSACSNNDEETINEEYLEINENWLSRLWWLSGEVNGRILDSAALSDNQVQYWDEEEGRFLRVSPFVVYHHKKGATLRPGQLTYGSETNFIIKEINHKKRNIKLRKVEDNKLTTTAVVRFLSGGVEDYYILHVNYDNTDFELEGYMR